MVLKIGQLISQFWSPRDTIILGMTSKQVFVLSFQTLCLNLCAEWYA